MLQSMKKMLFTAILIAISVVSFAQQSYRFLVYNGENLFDADGKALYDDYLPINSDGKPQYTSNHVVVKFTNAARLIARFGGGRGPDILGLVELEADQSPDPWPDASEFLKKYENQTLPDLLKDPIAEEIRSLPSHLLLLKALWDQGITDYDFVLAEPENEDGKRGAVHTNALFSRVPIQKEKTKVHPIQSARPILEAWVGPAGSEAVFFINHWKSGSSRAEMEQIRVQNASVLKSRTDEILAENPLTDIIIAGDLNCDYNQVQRYGFDESGINSVLGSTGNEQAIAEASVDGFYNLWFELPMDQRGSDSYRGEWGTLMHILISSGLYEKSGWYYADNTFEVGAIIDLNVKSWSGEPLRWESGKNGRGFSDHFPLYAEFVLSSGESGKLKLKEPSLDDSADFTPTKVSYKIPEEGSYYHSKILNKANLEEYEFLMFQIMGEKKGSQNIVVNGMEFGVYGPGYNFREALARNADADNKVVFFGRLNRYRGNWQFYVDSEKYFDR